ncbi:hypothetical protein Ddye_025763 [Dipteronia dyeriana]|uniref:Reverse transcriptase domain-containing protein n=1 Tax=Dipteronia dyeriana TaxID=168575 RepID=A0AAD9WPT9_9ROSI|nr:hypothetical protein Ddye_025763 [Dipteronia dyeriana]
MRVATFKINRCAKVLGKWNYTHRQDLQRQIKNKKNELATVSAGVSISSWKAIREIKGQLDELLEVEENYWKQQSRQDWLKAGYCNSKFFHWKASSHRARNTIAGLEDSIGEKVLDSIPLKLSSRRSKLLDLPFFAAYIKKATFDMFPTKAPEPESQSAFVPGRLITDNAIIGFECIHGLSNRVRKAGSVVIKLDMSKVYDRVGWDFISTMMLKLGFSNAWVDGIMRRGDPLSPYLFLICTEGLSCMIHKAVSCGDITRCHEKYRGLPSFVGRNKKQLFVNNLKERVWSKINGWKQKVFLIGGPILNEDALVRVLITPLGSWDVPLIHSSLSSEEVEVILSIPLSQRVNDFILWHFGKDGNYTVRSGYKLGQALQSIDSPSGSFDYG